MHVKYIVYYPNMKSNPTVDIWVTKGELTHPVYVRQHHIAPQSISSEGYLNFNPHKKRWDLEHYQMDDGVPPTTPSELWQQHKLKKRDILLVKKKIAQTSFLQNSLIQEKSFQTSKKVKRQKWIDLKKLFLFQND